MLSPIFQIIIMLQVFHNLENSNLLTIKFYIQEENNVKITGLVFIQPMNLNNQLKDFNHVQDLIIKLLINIQLLLIIDHNKLIMV